MTGEANIEHAVPGVHHMVRPNWKNQGHDFLMKVASERVSIVHELAGLNTDLTFVTLEEI